MNVYPLLGWVFPLRSSTPNFTAVQPVVMQSSSVSALSWGRHYKWDLDNLIDAQHGRQTWDSPEDHYSIHPIICTIICGYLHLSDFLLTIYIYLPVHVQNISKYIGWQASSGTSKVSFTSRKVSRLKLWRPTNAVSIVPSLHFFHLHLYPFFFWFTAGPQRKLVDSAVWWFKWFPVVKLIAHTYCIQLYMSYSERI